MHTAKNLLLSYLIIYLFSKIKVFFWFDRKRNQTEWVPDGSHIMWYNFSWIRVVLLFLFLSPFPPYFAVAFLRASLSIETKSFRPFVSISKIYSLVHGKEKCWWSTEFARPMIQAWPSVELARWKFRRISVGLGLDIWSTSYDVTSEMRALIRCSIHYLLLAVAVWLFGE